MFLRFFIPIVTVLWTSAIIWVWVSIIYSTEINGHSRQVQLENQLAKYKARENYLFMGAKERGYIDLCFNEAGESGIFFKDECQATEN